MTVLTLMLVGVCTVVMLFGIFMKYVNTSLLPTLDVKAEDYTMALSSVVYYQNRDSGEWVEFQKVHGQENRVWVDIERYGAGDCGRRQSPLKMSASSATTA